MTKPISTGWRRVVGSAAAVVMVASLVPVLAARQDTEGGAEGKRRHAGRMDRGEPFAGMAFGLRGLGLTDAQRDQVRAAVSGHDSEFKALAERGRAARQKLHAATTSESLDEAAIRSASSEVADVQADAAVLRAKVRQEVWSVLTPEQREKAKTLQAEREQRTNERRQRMQERLKQRRGNEQ